MMGSVQEVLRGRPMPMVGGAQGVPGRDRVSAGIQCLTISCKKLREVGEAVRCGTRLRGTS